MIDSNVNFILLHSHSLGWFALFIPRLRCLLFNILNRLCTIHIAMSTLMFLLAEAVTDDPHYN